MNASRFLIGCAAACFVATPASAITLNDFAVYAGTGPIFLNSNTVVHSGAIGTAGNFSTGTGVTFNDLYIGGNVTYINSNSVVTPGSTVHAGGSVVNTGSGTKFAGVDVIVGGTFTQSTAGAETPPTSITTGAAGPVLPSLPADSILAPSTEAGGNITATGGSLHYGALAPGDYGTLFVGSNGSIDLSAGDYHFTSFTTGTGVDINYDLSGGPITIFVDGDAFINSNSDFILTGGDGSDIYWELNGDFSAGTGIDLYGTIFTADGGALNLGDDEFLNSNTNLYGALFGTGMINTGTGVDVHHVLNDRFLAGPGPGPGPEVIPLPAALPLFISGLGALGLLGWRRKRRPASLQPA